MIDIKEAYNIAKRKANGFNLLEVLESEGIWIFCFGTHSDDGKLFPGAPNVKVNKKTGKAEYLVIPPIENLEILKAANHVDFQIKT